MYDRNIGGPWSVPCITPDSTKDSLELCPKMTHCFWMVKYKKSV